MTDMRFRDLLKCLYYLALNCGKTLHEAHDFADADQIIKVWMVYD